jgi:hypothetical protein
MVSSRYPVACNPDYYPKEQDLVRRSFERASASFGVFHEAITTRRNGDGQTQFERGDV